MDKVSKVKKLLRLSKSSNEHEAAVAAQKATELTLRYGLDLEKIKKQGIEPKEVSLRGGANQWHFYLLSGIAKIHHCRCFYFPTQKRLMLIAPEDEAEAIESVFLYLVETILRLSQEKFAARAFSKLMLQHTRDWYASFLMACSSRIVQYLNEQNQAEIERQQADSATHYANAIIPIYAIKDRRIAEAVAALPQTPTESKEGLKIVILSQSGYRAGCEAAAGPEINVDGIKVV